MRRALIASTLVVAAAAIAIVVVTPFLLPAPIYHVIYGWRYPKAWKVGDAVATDLGPRYAIDRYRVELADLRKPEVTTLKLHVTSLPEVELILGFDVHVSAFSEAILDAKPIRALTHLRVVNENGQVVIDHRAPLSQWVWSGAINQRSKSFVYARGDEREIPIGDDTVRLERAQVKADDGWGTYFVPRDDGRYTISLNIEARGPGVKIDNFRLVAYGGGWK
jgi:hypothetical protein